MMPWGFDTIWFLRQSCIKDRTWSNHDFMLLTSEAEESQIVLRIDVSYYTSSFES